MKSISNSIWCTSILYLLWYLLSALFIFFNNVNVPDTILYRIDTRSVIIRYDTNPLDPLFPHYVLMMSILSPFYIVVTQSSWTNKFHTDKRYHMPAEGRDIHFAVGKPCINGRRKGMLIRRYTTILIQIFLTTIRWRMKIPLQRFTIIPCAYEFRTACVHMRNISFRLWRIWGVIRSVISYFDIDKYH